MTDRPILFSAPMVQALLAGRKTQTRRALKPIPWNKDGNAVDINIAPTARYTQGADGGFFYAFDHPHGGPLTAHRARFAIGDRLWVKETWRTLQKWNDMKPRHVMDDPDKVDYSADGFPRNKLWAWCKTRVSIFMPRWASRLTLTVTDVRVERLQDCSEADAIAEGVRRIFPEGSRNDTGPYHFTVPIQHGSLNERTAKATYELLWNVINGPGAWEANPWVVAVSFAVHRCNIDQMPTPAPIEGGPL